MHLKQLPVSAPAVAQELERVPELPRAFPKWFRQKFDCSNRFVHSMDPGGHSNQLEAHLQQAVGLVLPH